MRARSACLLRRIAVVPHPRYRGDVAGSAIVEGLSSAAASRRRSSSTTGSPAAVEGAHGPALTALRRLLDKGNIWVKISGAGRLSASGRPYRDALAIPASLVLQAPERIVRDSHSPHVNLYGPMPDDSALVDLLGEVVSDARLRKRIRVDNPVELFGFRQSAGIRADEPEAALVTGEVLHIDGGLAASGRWTRTDRARHADDRAAGEGGTCPPGLQTGIEVVYFTRLSAK